MRYRQRGGSAIIMLTAYSECCRLAATAGCSRYHRRMAATPFPRLPVPGPSFGVLHAAGSTGLDCCTGRQRRAGTARTACQAASQPSQLKQEDRRKSERSKVRRRNRPQPPPPPPLGDASYDNDDSATAAEQGAEQLNSDRADRTAEASTSGEGGLWGREPAGRPPAPASVSAAPSAEAGRRLPAESIPAGNLQEEPAVEAQPDGGGERERPPSWEQSSGGLEAPVELDVEIVSLPDAPQPSVRPKLVTGAFDWSP